MRYDLAIIGSGGAAFAAAIAARRRDASVVMIEQGTVGGTCVNTGCVPSKALLAAAEARHVALSAGRFPGIHASAGEVAFGDLIAGKDALVQAMRADKYVDLADEYGWQIVAGTARFASAADGPVLDVALNAGGSTRIEAQHYLVATGSAPWIPPIEGLAEVGFLTSTTAMDLDTLPESMMVIGGNAVGLEQAQLFARLGTRVTVVEALQRLAPFEEPDASAVIEAVFADEGITVHTAAQATAARRDGDQVVLTVRAAVTATTSSCGRCGCWWPPAAARSPTDWAWTRSGSRPADTARSSSTSSYAPTTPASGPPGMSPAHPSLCMSPPHTATSWPITPSPTPATGWTTRTCPGSPSPALRSPRSV
jgi:pyruvate/2-oxoglutarate dehydrogenase complex dihydrolipoamide dehydrogenase (E3) component